MDRNVAIGRRVCTIAAFTFLEILAVLTIIGILSSLLVPSVSSVRLSARRQSSVWRFRGVIDAIRRYRDHFGDYPPFLRQPNRPFWVNDSFAIFRANLEGNVSLDSSRRVPIFHAFRPDEVSGDGRWIDDLGQDRIAIVRREEGALTIPRNTFPDPVNRLIPPEGVAEEIAIFSMGRDEKHCVVSW